MITQSAIWRRSWRWRWRRSWCWPPCAPAWAAGRGNFFDPPQRGGAIVDCEFVNSSDEWNTGGGVLASDGQVTIVGGGGVKDCARGRGAAAYFDAVDE